MALTSGQRIGVYEVTGSLGAGGMGEVYRATDTHLGRHVAIKVLPEAFAHDGDRLARFEREARTLAALNHPNIAAIYGLETSQSVHALVMELVEGDTLADLIARGPMPVGEALNVAGQIAEALQAAHEQGIVHRDLKPANVKVRDDGTAKVLDFGLAKAVDPSGSMPDVTLSPTVTSVGMTRAGVILGTAAYMSPEQARGRPADRRADIWAFGCVLFEMLTGQRAFAGDDVAEIFAAIIKTAPRLDLLPADVPAVVRDVLHRCLEKNPKERFQDIGDVRYELARVGAAAQRHGEDLSSASNAIAIPRQHTWRWAAAAIIMLIAGAGAALLWTQRPRGSLDITRLTVTPSIGNPLRIVGTDPSVAITADGRYVIYDSGRDNATGGITVRPLDKLDGARLSGLPPNVDSPFVSPDSLWIGYDDAGATLARVPVQGGPPQTITRIDGALRGASWGADNTIVFATAARGTGLFRVDAAGGTAESITRPADGEGDHLWPEILPGGRAVLFSIVPDAGANTGATVGVSSIAGAESASVTNAIVAVLDLESRTYKPLFRGGSNPRYVPTGHIVYGESGRLRAVAFDKDRLEVRGPPQLVVEGVATGANGVAHFGVANNGSLVYIATATGVVRSRVVWVARDGRVGDAVSAAPLQRPIDVRLSPDEQRLALSVSGDVWVYDLAGRPPIRLTTAGGEAPVWTRDGQQIVYRRQGGRRTIFRVPADGSGRDPDVASPEGNFVPAAVASDNHLIALHVDGPQRHIVRWPLAHPDTPERVVHSPGYEGAFGAALSPDGRWFAYTSNRDGGHEIWVQPYPGPGTPRRVSPAGGVEPVWARNGRELYYKERSRMMVVPVTLSGDFSFSAPRVLFDTGLEAQEVQRSYDVAGDGRFVTVQRVGDEPDPEPPRIVVVQNWQEELKRLVPTP